MEMGSIGAYPGVENEPILNPDVDFRSKIETA
jgi:hypothetical protein